VRTNTEKKGQMVLRIQSKAVSSGPGGENLQKWCLTQEVPPETLQCVKV
jgi:hypothetical protein